MLERAEDDPVQPEGNFRVALSGKTLEQIPVQVDFQGARRTRVIIVIQGLTLESEGTLAITTAPTIAPTAAPTAVPTADPTLAPTDAPTAESTVASHPMLTAAPPAGGSIICKDGYHMARAPARDHESDQYSCKGAQIGLFITRACYTLVV